MEHGHQQLCAGQSAQDDTSDKLARCENSPRFYENERVSRRAQQWVNDPTSFFRHIPQRCIACQVFMRTQPWREQPEEDALINTIELRIYLVFFHLLRAAFRKCFYTKGYKDPLVIYLVTHKLGEESSLSKCFSQMDKKGGCYHALATETKHFGVLLLSTAFNIATLETKGESASVSAAAIEDIPGIDVIQMYDNATSGIFNIFHTSLQKWIDSMAQRYSYKLTRVEHLIDLQKESSSDQNPPCPSPFDIQLVTVPETSAAPGTFLAFPQTATVAVCVDGTMRYFDPSMVLSIPDTSRVMRQVCVGALAEGSNFPVLAAPQSNYPPSSEVADEYIYSPTDWPGLTG
ncbi:hypothetical protein B0J15DRAFT_553857 [Fusarium solani]|uniref:Uncharacterized protein n=1 Tax=Fusarium solani TaxID=169388 RepID=A0A9P9GH38_FUSSL|nr:uncharacterized protein B0J15DRAFT_553857 [Fusarium solani]KAH7237847.1 hypothetical protein B0J15DRAFT_553857 [Fusarium solani]